MVEEIKLALVVSFELVMTSVFILIVTVASFDGTIKEVNLEWVDGVVVVIVDFKGVVVNDVVDVDIVVFEGVVVVDLVVDFVGAAHFILKSLLLSPVETKDSVVEQFTKDIGRSHTTITTDCFLAISENVRFSCASLKEAVK